MSALEGTATLPAVGKVKKSYVVVGGAAIAGVVGYAWWNRSRSLQDQAAPDFYADTRTGSDLPTDGYSNPGGIDTSAPSDPDGFRAPKTDQEWAQAVIEKLSWYEPGYVSSVVGKYLSGQTVTATEADVIREAWAQVGRPPGNQPLRTSTTPTPTPTPTPTDPRPGALAAPWLHHVLPSRTSAVMQWNAVAGAKGYRVWVNSTGRNVGAVTGYTFSPLKPGTSYTFRVAAIDSKNKVGPMSAPVQVSTKK